jgi:23S rRNA (uracil1939-C5)-methyltransferase
LRLNIEKLIYGGDGLSRLPGDSANPGKAVFIPFVLTGEKVEASITQEKSNFARARINSIAEPSPHRIAPACPYFAQCGGCHYQQADYDHQLRIKKDILRENLRRIAKLDLPFEIETHPSPPWNYRNRARLQIRIQPNFVAGYFRFGTHNVMPIEQCPISSPLINRAIAALWQAGREGKVAPGVREIEFFADQDDSHLLIELVCEFEARRAAVRGWAEELCAALPEVAGIAAFRESQKGVQELLVTVGSQEMMFRTKTSAYRITAGSFFQTNRFLVDRLVRIVTANRTGNVAFDLYAGVGLFSTELARNFDHTVSVETSQTSFSDLQYNLPRNGKAVRAAAEKFLGLVDVDGRVTGGADLPQVRHKPDLGKPDLVVIDPPRSGVGDRVARSLTGLNAPRITYVSCDPATLARDLVPLQAAGYRAEEVHLVDLFPQTYHLESVVQLVRE